MIKKNCNHVWKDKNVPMYLCAWHVLKNWKKNIISKVPKDGDLNDYIFQALKVTTYNSIEYEKNIEIFLGTHKRSC
jgi:hypothetical protein